jgi:hypothetical protein
MRSQSLYSGVLLHLRLTPAAPQAVELFHPIPCFLRDRLRSVVGSEHREVALLSEHKRADKHFNGCFKAMGDLPRKRKVHPAALYEMFERHSQCVKTQEGKCPLLVFTTQLCEEINE